MEDEHAVRDSAIQYFSNLFGDDRNVAAMENVPWECPQLSAADNAALYASTMEWRRRWLLMLIALRARMDMGHSSTILAGTTSCWRSRICLRVCLSL